MTKLARVWRIYVATEDFYVATELAMIESSVAHYRAGRVKASAHDSVAPCCVATEKVMRATDQARRIRQALGVHDKGMRATGEFCRNKDLSVATNLDSDEKKRPPRF